MKPRLPVATDGICIHPAQHESGGIDKNSMARTTKVLEEALPYIYRFADKRIVIKCGGAVLEEDAPIDSVLEDIVLLKDVGLRPIVVHGGGPRISALMTKMGKKAQFVQGLRVTDAETVEIAEMVLAGSINKSIVARINQHGGRALAIGLSGKDAKLVVAEKQEEMHVTNEEGHQISLDLGFVGKIIDINPDPIITLDKAGYIPVIASTGVGDDGQTYNINADTLASRIAGELQAEKLIMLTDTPGILRDIGDDASLESTIHFKELDTLIETGVITGGMLPKVEACKEALKNGVSKTHIIGGRTPRSLLLEIFTEGGVGTEIVR